MGLRTTVAAATLLPLITTGLVVGTSSTANAAIGAHIRESAPRPPRVTNLAPYKDGSTVTLGWHDPAAALFRRVIVRYERGAAAPATPNDGTPVHVAAARSTTATLTGLTPGRRYSAAVWVRGTTGRLSPRTATHFVLPSDVPQALGTVLGTVVDGRGAPLSGVAVMAYDRDDFDGWVQTVTDASGDYRLRAPAGQLFIAYDGSNAQGGQSDATGYVGTFRTVTAIAHRDVTINTSLHGGAEITGRVVDGNGDPLADVATYAIPVTSYVSPDADSNNSSFVSYTFEDGQTTTGADGTFALKGVGPDDVQTCFDPDDADTEYAESANGPVQHCIDPPQQVHAGQVLDVGTTTLASRPRGNLTGRVVDDAGNGIANAAVYVAPVGRRYSVGYAETGSDGSYTIFGLKPGDYRVCADGSGVASASGLGYLARCRPKHVTVVAGQTTANARVVLHSGGSVSGVVQAADGTPVAGASISVGRRYWTTTDADGRWSAGGLRSGRYRVCVDASGIDVAGHPGGVRGRCTGRRPSVVVRRGRARIGADLSLVDGAAIRGTVVAGPGQPLGGVDVDVSGDMSTLSSGDFAFAETGPKGHFVIEGLPPGKYRLCFDDEPLVGGWLSACSHHSVNARDGRVNNFGTEDFDATGSVTATVQDSDGTALNGVDVAVLRPCHKRFSCDTSPMVAGRFQVVASWVTEGNGTVRLPHLRPGNYQFCMFGYLAAPVTGTPPPTGYADGCSSDAFNVRVANGRGTAVSATLPLAGEVTGTLTDTTGAPLVGVLVHVTGSAVDDVPNSESVFSPFEDPVFSRAVTATDGSYAVRSVGAGEQTVCVRPDREQLNPTRFRKQCYGGQPGGTTGTPVPVTAGQVTSGISFAVQRKS